MVLGVTFECPHCRTQRLGIAFHHAGHEAIEDSVIKAKGAPDYIWTIYGSNFEDVTFAPSIDASGVGHWHGTITKGEVK